MNSERSTVLRGTEVRLSHQNQKSRPRERRQSGPVRVRPAEHILVKLMNNYREILYASYRTTAYEQVNPGGLNRHHIENYASELGDLLPLDKHARILDLGAGKGFLVQFLMLKGYENVLGVDVSQDQVDFARRQGLPVTQANAFEFLRFNKGFDLIVATDVIEHLTKNEIVEFLEGIRGALVPGGSTILMTGNASSIYGGTITYIDFTHETSFTERSLHQILLACGFERISITDNKVRFGWKPKRLLRWALVKAWRAILTSIYTLEVGEDRPRLFGKLLIAQAFKPLKAQGQDA